MGVTREEILDALERHSHGRRRAKLRAYRDMIDDATDLHLELGLDSFIFVDMLIWLGTRLSRRITVDEITEEDLTSIGGMLRLAERYQTRS